jgi:acyl-CoA reductase-like NAD-dependent aldehyde dehydrogenase
VLTYEALYIDGKWTAPAVGGGTTEVLGAADGAVIGRVPSATPADIDAAVAAARAAFPGWAATPPAARAAMLEALLGALKSRAEVIAETISLEVGTPLKMSQRVQLGVPLAVLGSYAKLAATYEWEREVGNSLITREPVGVVGAITPWNYPLHQVVAKVSAALAAGCTIVVKPADVAPLTAFLLAEALDEIGLPPGVVNIVSGDGPNVGEALAGHPGIDMLSFTGSAAVGARVAGLAGANIAKVSLELGGKSANVVLADADLDKAVGSGVNYAFLNSGQTCSAWTRLLIPRQLQDEALAIISKSVARLTVGHPLAETTRLGPLASAAQRDRVRDYIEVGIAEGARLVLGGPEAPDGLDEGYYVRPTVFADVTPGMRIAQEEIFGPVLSVLPYDDEDEAVGIANDSEYGLHGGVWSADADRALAVARRLRTGQVDVNGGAWNPLAPFGGYKKSGLGRELGEAGLEEYLEIKAIQR